MTDSKKHRNNRESGQSAVEFALLLPVFILIMLVILEFGRLWMTVNIISGAAREGARVAAVTAPDAGAVQNAANNVLNSASVTNANITVSAPNAANEVTVTVQVNYTVLTGSLIPGLSGTLQLTRTATMRWEG